MNQKITLEWVLNGKTLFTETDPFVNVQVLLKQMGILSVRDSDNHTGFAGSDTILLDGKPVNAGLMIAAQLDGHDVVTAEFLAKGNQMDPVQAALVDAGCGSVRLQRPRLGSGPDRPAQPLQQPHGRGDPGCLFQPLLPGQRVYPPCSRRLSWLSSTGKTIQRIWQSLPNSGTICGMWESPGERSTVPNWLWAAGLLWKTGWIPILFI